MNYKIIPMRKITIIIICFFSIMLLHGQSNFKFAEDIDKEDHIIHTGFELSYNTSYALPSWVGYKLTKEHISNPDIKIRERYVPDPKIKIRASTKNDYKNSGYLMAQLVPCYDLLFSEQAVEETFYMSNIVPQKLAFNKYIWTKLEDLIREWIRSTETFYIVAGPVLTDAPFKTFGDNKTSLPIRYYKAILDIEEKRAIAFVFRNSMSSNSIQSFSVSIDELEELTDIDFFPSLPDELETELEADKAVEKWNFEVLEE